MMPVRLLAVRSLLCLITFGTGIFKLAGAQSISSGNLTNNLPSLPILGDPLGAPAAVVGRSYRYSDDNVHLCIFTPRRLTRSSRVPSFYELTPLLMDAFSYAYDHVSLPGVSSSQYMAARGYTYSQQNVRMTFHHNWKETHGVPFSAFELCIKKLAIWAQNFQISNTDIAYAIQNNNELRVMGLGYVTF